MADPTSLWEILSSAGTLGAAIIAGIAAKFSYDSASSTLAAAQVAQQARRDEILPRFVVSQDFLGLMLIYTGEDLGNGESLIYGGVKDYFKKEYGLAQVSLENVGQGPCYDVGVVFELFDLGLEIYMPERFGPYGLTVEDDDLRPPSSGRLKILYFQMADQIRGIPLYRRMRVNLPHCAPGSKHEIEIPKGVLNRIFMRGLQNREFEFISQQYVLDIKVQGHSAEGDFQLQLFRFIVTPFSNTDGLPIRVDCHFSPVALHPDVEDNSAALG